MDILTELRSVLAEIDPNADVRLRSVPSAVLDVRVFASEPARVGRLLAQHPRAAAWIESIALGDRRLRVRLTDYAVAIAGSAIDEQGSDAFTRPLLDVTDAVVAFCDPNATKALHIGHMRNLIVGEALASLLEFAGSEVVRQSIVCDTGQIAAEAVAGYLAGLEHQTPESTGLAPDAFVGRCYAEFTRQYGDERPQEPDAESRAVTAPERADVPILHRMRAFDPEVMRIWAQLRAWVLEGHQRTLARLGIEFDRVLYESDALASVQVLMARARDMDVFVARDDGALEMADTDSAGRRLTMMRPDGQETGYMRRFAIWCDLNETCGRPVRCINLNGSEWTQGTRLRDTGVKRMVVECPLYDDYRLLPVGMVRVGGRTVTSRSEDALLIEASLNWLLGRLAASPHASLFGDAETTARLLLACALLSPPVSRPMDFDLRRVLDSRMNPGWSIGRALQTTRAPEPADAWHGVGQDQSYRFGVLSAYALSQAWRCALDSCEPRLVIRHLHSLSEWYLSADRSERLDRVVRTALLTGLASVGLRL